MLKYIKYTFYLVAVIVLLLEMVLRIYHPFPNRIKNGRIYLTANRTFYQSNLSSKIPGLDSEIKTHFNSLGFRGPEKPTDYDSSLSIITIGGSTTFCLYLSEGETWPDLLAKNLSSEFKKVWLNNAGINGHSTFGHQILLEDHIIPLKPKMVIFMLGINDLGRDRLKDENVMLKDSSSKNLRTFLMKNSEVYNLIATINGALKVKKFDLPLPNIDLRKKQVETLELTTAEILALTADDSLFVQQYGQRIRKLAKTCLTNNIVPVFVTQPLLGGKVIDDVTGVNLETVKIIDSVNSGLIALKLDKYNKELLSIADEMHLPSIDLASLMPVSSRYYFDLMHFNNEGALKVSALLAPRLTEIIKTCFPQFRKQ